MFVCIVCVYLRWILPAVSSTPRPPLTVTHIPSFIRGDYAYVKIVDYLHAAGAKFRVLGLSATPGTNIKAIQRVVDALRINRIEARTESDPSVSKYIHERNTEIVLVPQVSVSKNIEHALNGLIAPLLEKLRSNGALAATGVATVTAFTIIKSRETYIKCGGDKSLMGYFMAAQTFVQMKADLHRHGVGLVRTKLMRLRTEPQRGILSSLVKGKEFILLVEQVQNATSGPNSSEDNVQDKLVNNPKLFKLQEILTEHFERARACSNSSRAIVFSQFRDSVSEIVYLLEASKPLIRPRHFVGQGNTSKGEGQLKGMKQAEQHEAIRQFRSDIYNVLVCTCIGEEGKSHWLGSWFR
jgi:ERCC4-related helicase